jgi:hypothetical protein
MSIANSLHGLLISGLLGVGCALNKINESTG